MGNHDVGRGMGAAARGFWAGNGDAPVTKEKALAVLDAIGEQYRGADAEFDDETYPDEPLGRLMAVPRSIQVLLTPALWQPHCK